MGFGENLKYERNKKGWSQEELAKKLSVNPHNISEWEENKDYPNIEIVVEISNLLGVTTDKLLKINEDLQRSKKELSHPNLKITFDVLLLIGIVMLFVKIINLLLNRFTELNSPLYGGSVIWNSIPMILMVIGGIGSSILKEKFKEN